MSYLKKIRKAAFKLSNAEPENFIKLSCLAKEADDRIKHLEKQLQTSHNHAHMLNARIANDWLPINEFTSLNTQGPCWIVHNGVVIFAWYSATKLFLHAKYSSSSFISSHIIKVMVIHKPEI